MKYIAAIDQGTSSTRCMIFDRKGVVASAQGDHQQLFPQPGWVEHDPMEILHTTWRAVREAMDKAGISARDIAAVGVTNQRETTVVWDQHTGKPFCNAIVWQDVRTDAICKRFSPDAFRLVTGLPTATYFSGPKLAWILDNVPGVRDAARAGRALFGTIDTWLIWNLTGAHVTDVTNASRTMLMDLRTLTWDDRLVREFGIERSMLPKIVASSDSEAFGRTREQSPFGGVVPITGVLGDQHAALVGQACFSVGESKNTYGTGAFLLMNIGGKIAYSQHGLITTVAYQFAGQQAVYALEGSIAVAGAVVTWLRDKLGIISTSAEVESLAGKVSDNAGVYFVPAFSGLFAPYWKSDARGVIVGLTQFTEKAHVARAALEAVAYQTRDVIEAMARDSGITIASLKADGGMVTNELLMQFQSDVLGVPVERSAVAETTSLGAAYAAGLAIGYWENLASLKANWQVSRTWKPVMDNASRDRLYARWRNAVQRSFNLA